MMFEKLFGKKKKEGQAAQEVEVKAYADGEVIALKDVNDGVFSEGILGEGIALKPSKGEVVSPADGVIVNVADTKHSCGIQLDNGVTLLIHIGLDTVMMNGEGFEVQVKNGQKVKTGKTLITFDCEKIKEAGHPDTIMLIVAENEEEREIEYQPYQKVTANKDIVLKIR